MRAVLFNGFNLQSKPFKVQGTDAFSAPVRDIIVHELARSDNAVDVFRRYNSRNINLNGSIHADDEVGCDLAIDQLKLKVMQAGKGQLQMGYAGGYRYWAAEAKNLNIARRATDLSTAAWSVQMLVAKFYATDGNRDVLIDDEVVTTDSANILITPLGTYLSRPLITITYGAIDPSDSDLEITIGNPNSNDYLSITETIQPGDVLSIDTLYERVFLNSELLKPVGSFPAWQPGQTSGFDYSDTATTRSATIRAEADRVFI